MADYHNRYHKPKRSLTEEEKAALIAKLREAGIEPGDKINTFQLLKTNRPLYNALRNAARNTGNITKTEVIIKALNHEPVYSIDWTKKHLIDELKRMYSPALIQESLDGKTTLPTYSDFVKESKFFKKYRDQQSNRSRRIIGDKKNHQNNHPPLRELMLTLYPEFPQLPYLAYGKLEKTDYDLEKAGKTLQELVSQGQDIFPAALENFQNGFLLKWLDSQVRKKKGQTLTGLIEKLSGSTRAEFSPSSEFMHKVNKRVAEDLVNLMLWATYTLDPSGEKQSNVYRKLFPRKLTGVYPKLGREDSEDVGLEHKIRKNEAKRADAIVTTNSDTNMIEVKHWRYANHTNVVSLQKKLSQPLVWAKTGGPITKKALISLSPKRVSENLGKKLTNHDIEIVHAEEFKEMLNLALRETYKHHKIKTSTYGVADFMQAYDVIIEKPALLLRESHRPMLQFVGYMIRDALRYVQEKDRPTQEPISVYRKRPQDVTFEGKHFKRITFSLNQLPNGKLKSYVGRRINQIPKGTLYYDLETTGLSPKKDIVYSVCYAHANKDSVEFRLDYATNPLQEAALLKHFVQYSKNFPRIVSYNGNSFDDRRVRTRLQLHSENNQFMGTTDDYLPKARRAKLKEKYQLSSYKLMNLAQIFGEVRTDLPGSESEKAYRGHLYGKDSTMVSGILEHTLQDDLTLIALDLSPKLFK